MAAAATDHARLRELQRELRRSRPSATAEAAWLEASEALEG